MWRKYYWARRSAVPSTSSFWIFFYWLLSVFCNPMQLFFVCECRPAFMMVLHYLIWQPIFCNFLGQNSLMLSDFSCLTQCSPRFGISPFTEICVMFSTDDTTFFWHHLSSFFIQSKDVSKSVCKRLSNVKGIDSKKKDF